MGTFNKLQEASKFYNLTKWKGQRCALSLNVIITFLKYTQPRFYGEHEKSKLNFKSPVYPQAN